MGYNWEVIGETGLQFFGKMSTSMSHELKNALAIINENAGLLQDFTLMADKGLPMDPQRLKTLAEKVMTQIRRADRIVKNMNRFSHSVDESVKSIDLHSIVELVATLSGRFALMRGVNVELSHPANPVMITTNPFFLQNLVWLCLDFAMDAAGDGKSVTLIGEETDRGARIRFTGLEGLEGMPTTSTFPAEREKALIEILKADIAVDVEVGEFVLGLPRKIGR
jgi:signal transduction histidine kinase